MLTAAQKERVDKIKNNLDLFTSLKNKTFGSAKSWRRSGRQEDGFTLMSGDVTICEFGDYYTRGGVEETALNFVVHAHNCAIEDDVEYLLALVEGPKK
ncbi:hypothetical protein AYO40_01060 [Planctomycetaceae bacterium SCGC AG-212-D15]|nr:hypothetical protein AYO40_01060 [Planctomycetaceae bacterium SCGC AG-212-D15]